MADINHTFCLCAYKESPYLEQCLKSLLDQTVPTNVLIATSTPNDYIFGIAKKYDVPVFVNTGKTGIQEDWNFAVSQAKTTFVTVCHHDDYYFPNYVENILKVITKKKAIEKVLYIHTGYKDVNAEGELKITKVNRVKRIINFWMRFGIFQRSRFCKRMALSFGNSVCCPSCTYNTHLLGQNFFQSELSDACDWDFYYTCIRKKGKAVYIPKPSMAKRYHAESTTTADLASGKRQKEEVIMFRKFWPAWVVKLIMKKYVEAYKSNE